jgi:cell wall-associated NlpC family hydrolase
MKNRLVLSLAALVATQLAFTLPAAAKGLQHRSEVPPPRPADQVQCLASANLERPTSTRVVALGRQQIGVPYVWGGANRLGFDCSGLVRYVFALAAIGLPRTADKQMAWGTPIAISCIRSGDLLFFHTTGRGHEPTHVGIYIGNGRMIHAPRTGERVRIAGVQPGSWFARRLVGARRLEHDTYRLARRGAAVWLQPLSPATVAGEFSNPGAGSSMLIAHF